MIDNRCFEVHTTTRQFGWQSRVCDQRASTLFTPVTHKDFLLVEKLMDLYNIDKVFAGKFITAVHKVTSTKTT